MSETFEGHPPRWLAATQRTVHGTFRGWIYIVDGFTRGLVRELRDGRWHWQAHDGSRGTQVRSDTVEFEIEAKSAVESYIADEELAFQMPRAELPHPQSWYEEGLLDGPTDATPIPEMDPPVPFETSSEAYLTRIWVPSDSTGLDLFARRSYEELLQDSSWEPLAPPFCFMLRLQASSWSFRKEKWQDRLAHAGGTWSPQEEAGRRVFLPSTREAAELAQALWRRFPGPLEGNDDLGIVHVLVTREFFPAVHPRLDTDTLLEDVSKLLELALDPTYFRRRA